MKIIKDSVEARRHDQSTLNMDEEGGQKGHENKEMFQKATNVKEVKEQCLKFILKRPLNEEKRRRSFGNHLELLSRPGKTCKPANHVCVKFCKVV